MEPEEKSLDASPVTPTENEIVNQSAAGLKEPKEEPLELFSFENEIPRSSFTICKEEEVDEDEKDSSDTVEANTKRGSWRISSRSLKRPDSVEESDEDVKPTAKRSRSESELKTATPKCLFCEMYPATAYGYAFHLDKYHNTTLKANGIYLLYSCGFEFRSHNIRGDKHCDECNGGEFTIRKLNRPRTPKCVHCEMYPTTAAGYANHLRTHHNTTLKASGIYLLYSCGFEFRSHNIRGDKHCDECNGGQFSIRKLGE